MKPLRVLIVGVGGLGKCLVLEALERDLPVSVLVRNQEKLRDDLGEATLAKLENIHVGDGTDAQVLDKAMQDIDVVLSGRGAAPDLARELAAAVKRNGVKKLCWPGGTTNVMAEDGITPNYKELQHLGSWVEQAYALHGACIDIIRKAGINYVIFCPGRMQGTGRRSPDVQATIRINRDAGPFVSYEDAAWVLLEAATTDSYDHQLISAATPQTAP
ncbi:NAD(P)-dependent oxidoreductase [Desulfobulbus oligotrophicus]|jgi:putative NADH-flavin reductase|uniref:NAD(P)H-binding protein n=1 Tax=Desulfobulbus oligotrophicus TaxID=1909699 RepID=A0A7T5VD88_9BACT|nr:NAD(P)H-binding protein [Desulfobulbus oligotrophicus]MDY0391061.1 NAD(P)H-binding protein [Desulfobulbus oligotrophicus]QQG65666.1 NAD(P)H-binding protein [Desulfobulbus oligotrophicus]